MSGSKKKAQTDDLKWIVERKTASVILNSLLNMGKASRYDLASALGLSYATVMNYIEKFEEAGVVEKVGEVEAERGGTKTIFAPTEIARDVLLKAKPSQTARIETIRSTTLPSLGFYSLSQLRPKEKRSNRAEEILRDMKVDLAIVLNYRGHPIPIMPISTLGNTDQVKALFREEVGKRILAIAIQAAQQIAEEK